MLLRLLPRWLQDEFARQLAITNLANGTQALRHISLTVGNIRIRLISLEEVVFEHSLHRFFHGHNGGLFTKADIAAAIERLSDALGFDVSLGMLRRVDPALNLVPADPERVQNTLRSINDYKGKLFTRWERGNVITSIRRELTTYNVKFYDKQYELARRRLAVIPATLRLELTSNRPARVRQLGAYTVADLTSTRFLEAAGTALVNCVKACGFNEPLDWSLLTPDEVEAVALVSNTEAFQAYKSNRANKDRCTRRRKLAELARQKAALTNIKAELLTLVQDAVSKAF